jgi:hypothetical protein
MWAMLVAVAVSSPGLLTRPSIASRAPLRGALAQPVVRADPPLARKVEAPQEGAGLLARALSGVELNGPLVLKPDFQRGPGAAIALKF